MMKLGVVLTTSLLLLGCADAVSFVDAEYKVPVGFLHGVWHGFILTFAWIASLFDDSVAIYAIYNDGGWYDFGFIVGAGNFAGLLSALTTPKPEAKML